MVGKGERVGIRLMEPQDIEVILAIDHKISGVQRALTYEDLINAVVGGQIDLSFVAEVDSQVIGFVLARLTYIPEESTEACVIQMLGVSPDYWRQGVATKLIRALLGESRSKGIKMVRVLVDEHDSQLRGFFEHMEFGRGHFIDYSTAL